LEPLVDGRFLERSSYAGLSERGWIHAKEESGVEVVMAEVIYVRGGKGCELSTDKDKQLTPEEHVWQYAHPRDPRQNTTLTLFDYAEGVYKQWSNWRGELPPKNAKSPTKKESILSGGESCGSIIFLYDYIKQIGGTNPQSILELHFFTHGWHEGPILIDTDEDEEHANEPTKRDPKDKDTRLKDFDIPEVLGGKAGNAFKQGFAQNGFVKLWGCDFEQEHRDRVKNYYRTRDARERKSELEAYLRYIRDSTYAYRLRKLLGIPVYAAPLGWGTSPYLPFGIEGKAALQARVKYTGIWPPRKGDNWWRVSSFFRPDKGFEFYTKILRAQFDILDYVDFSDVVVNKLPEQK
jgi:hypothetical protein